MTQAISLMTINAQLLSTNIEMAKNQPVWLSDTIHCFAAYYTCRWSDLAWLFEQQQQQQKKRILSLSWCMVPMKAISHLRLGKSAKPIHRSYLTSRRAHFSSEYFHNCRPQSVQCHNYWSQSSSGGSPHRPKQHQVPHITLIIFFLKMPIWWT